MAETPAIRVATPGESGRDHIIVSPFQFYVNGEDHLRVTSSNSLTGVILEITGRFFDQDAQQISPIQEPHVPNTDRSIKQTLIRLGKGYLLNLAVRAIAGTPIGGQTFVILELVRGFDGATQFLGVMGQGYVTARQGIAWPGSPIESSLEGPGYMRAIAGSAPAAGAEISETVPTGARWRFRHMFATFTASATVINRSVGVKHVSSGSTVRMEGVKALTASQIYRVTFLPGANDDYSGATGGAMHVPIPPDYPMRAADTFGTITVNIQVGDQWTAPVYVVDEWLDP